MLDRTLSVAPMMGCTDRHCRYLFRLISPNALLYTEMLVTGALIHGDAGHFQRIRKLGEGMLDTVFIRDLARGLEGPAHQRDDFYAVDVANTIEVFDAEGAGACKNDLH